MCLVSGNCISSAAGPSCARLRNENVGVCACAWIHVRMCGFVCGSCTNSLKSQLFCLSASSYPVALIRYVLQTTIAHTLGKYPLLMSLSVSSNPAPWTFLERHIVPVRLSTSRMAPYTLLLTRAHRALVKCSALLYIGRHLGHSHCVLQIMASIWLCTLTVPLQIGTMCTCAVVTNPEGGERERRITSHCEGNNIVSFLLCYCSLLPVPVFKTHKGVIPLMGGICNSGFG